MAGRNHYNRADEWANGGYESWRSHPADRTPASSYYYPVFESYNVWDDTNWNEKPWANDRDNARWSSESYHSSKKYHNDGRNRADERSHQQSRQRQSKHSPANVPKRTDLRNNSSQSSTGKDINPKAISRNSKTEIQTSSKPCVVRVCDKNKHTNASSTSALSSKSTTIKNTSGSISSAGKGNDPSKRIGVSAKNSKTVKPVIVKPKLPNHPLGVSKGNATSPVKIAIDVSKKASTLKRPPYILDKRTIKRLAEGTFNSRDEATLNLLIHEYTKKNKPKLSDLRMTSQTTIGSGLSICGDVSSVSSTADIENDGIKKIDSSNQNLINNPLPSENSIDDRRIGHETRSTMSGGVTSASDTSTVNSVTSLMCSPTGAIKKTSKKSNSSYSMLNRAPIQSSYSPSECQTLGSPRKRYFGKSRISHQLEPTSSKKLKAASAQINEQVCQSHSSTIQKMVQAKKSESVMLGITSISPTKTLNNGNVNQTSIFQELLADVTLNHPVIKSEPLSDDDLEASMSMPGSNIEKPSEISSDELCAFPTSPMETETSKTPHTDVHLQQPVIKIEPLSADDVELNSEHMMHISEIQSGNLPEASSDCSIPEVLDNSSKETGNCSQQEQNSDSCLDQPAIKTEPILEEAENNEAPQVPSEAISTSDITENALLELLTSGQIKCESEVPQNAYLEKHFDTSVLNSHTITPCANTQPAPCRGETNLVAPPLKVTQPSRTTILDLFCLTEKQKVLNGEGKKIQELIDEVQLKLITYKEQMSQIQKDQEEVLGEKQHLTDMLRVPMQSSEFVPSTINQIDTGSSAILCLEIHKDSIIVGCADGTLKMISYLDQTDCKSFHGHTQKVTALQPYTSILYSISSDKSMLKFDLETTAIMHMVNFKCAVMCMCLGWHKLYLGFLSGDVLVYDIQKDAQSDVFKGAKSGIAGMQTAAQGAQHLICIASYDKSITVWDAESKLLLQCLDMNISPSVHHQMKILNNCIYINSPPCEGPGIFVHEAMSGDRKQKVNVHSCATNFHVQKGCMTVASVDRRIRFYKKANDVWSICAEINRSDSPAPITCITGQGHIVFLADKLGKVDLISL